MNQPNSFWEGLWRRTFNRQNLFVVVWAMVWYVLIAVVVLIVGWLVPSLQAVFIVSVTFGVLFLLVPIVLHRARLWVKADRRVIATERPAFQIALSEGIIIALLIPAIFLTYYSFCRGNCLGFTDHPYLRHFGITKSLSWEGRVHSGKSETKR